MKFHNTESWNQCPSGLFLKVFKTLHHSFFPRISLLGMARVNSCSGKQVKLHEIHEVCGLSFSCTKSYSISVLAGMISRLNFAEIKTIRVVVSACRKHENEVHYSYLICSFALFSMVCRKEIRSFFLFFFPFFPCLPAAKNKRDELLGTKSIFKIKIDMLLGRCWYSWWLSLLWTLVSSTSLVSDQWIFCSV